MILVYILNFDMCLPQSLCWCHPGVHCTSGDLIQWSIILYRRLQPPLPQRQEEVVDFELQCQHIVIT